MKDNGIFTLEEFEAITGVTLKEDVFYKLMRKIYAKFTAQLVMEILKSNPTADDLLTKTSDELLIDLFLGDLQNAKKNAKKGKSKCKIWMLYLKKTLKELLLWFVLSATESRHPKKLQLWIKLVNLLFFYSWQKNAVN